MRRPCARYTHALTQTLSRFSSRSETVKAHRTQLEQDVAMDRLSQLKAKLLSLNVKVLPEEASQPGRSDGTPVVVKSVAPSCISSFLFETNALLRLRGV